MKPAATVKGSIEVGTPVIVRYLDHVKFENADSSQYKPWTLELIGWLEHEDQDSIRVISERYAELRSSGKALVRSTGIAIVKSTIVELRSLGSNGNPEKGGYPRG